MIENQEFTYIGKSSDLTGHFEFNGSTHLQGKLKGEITVGNQSKLVLEIGSNTTAQIKCVDIDIYGEFSGEIRSTGRVTIYPTAIIEGIIISKALEILPGAIVNINGHTEESL